MAQGVIKSLSEDFVHCSICTEPYNEPKVLPCLHSFCLKCLKQWAHQSEEHSFSCPTCRSYVELPSDGIASLPNGFFLVSLMERLEEAETLSKQNQDCNCNICRSNLGTVFCLDCKMHICQTCKVTHNRLTRTNDHPLVPSEKLSDITYLQRVLSSQAPYCNIHKQEKVRYYCTECSQLSCLVCVVVSHQGHKSVLEVESRVSSVRTDLETLLEQGRTQTNDVQEKLKQTKKVSEKIKCEILDLRSKIESRYNEIVTRLRCDKKQLEEQLLVIENTEYGNLEDIEEEICNWLKAMENTQLMTRKILEQNNSCEILEMQRNVAESFSKVEANKGRVDVLALPAGLSCQFLISSLTVLKIEEREILKRAELQRKKSATTVDNSQQHLNEENWIGKLNHQTERQNDCPIS